MIQSIICMNEVGYKTAIATQHIVVIEINEESPEPIYSVDVVLSNPEAVPVGIARFEIIENAENFLCHLVSMIYNEKTTGILDIEDMIIEHNGTPYYIN